jgi:hypothetical protein
VRNENSAWETAKRRKRARGREGEIESKRKMENKEE